MTTYYVRKTGSDAANGLSAGTAWLTIDKAANTVAAGDTVYIGAGVYRELVTMDTAGSVGSVISYIGDISGEQTGDGGLVVISAHDNDRQSATRASCLDVNGKEFLLWKHIVFAGCTTAGAPVFSSVGTNTAYEGVIFRGCSAVSDTVQYAFSLDLHQAPTPTGEGLVIEDCVAFGGIKLTAADNATAERNAKVRISRSLVLATRGQVGVYITIDSHNASGPCGGFTVENCTILGSGQNGVYGQNLDSTNYPLTVRDCYVVGFFYALERSGGASGGMISGGGNVYNTNTVYSSVTGKTQDSITNLTPFLLGGIADLPMYHALGWSPFKPWEPIVISGMYSAGAGESEATTAPTVLDLYGNSPNQGLGISFAFFNASDDAVSDPDSKWSSDANAVDGNAATAAWTTTSGSAASNFLTAGGTNFPDVEAGIVQVRARAYGGTDYEGSSATVTIYTDGFAEALGTITVTVFAGWAQGWSGWTTLATPSGGWTAAKVAALEFKAWEVASSDTYLAKVQLEVTTRGRASTGAVQQRVRPVAEATITHAGDTSLEFAGPGYHDMLVPVDATSTTVSVWVYRDTDYSGDNPILEVLNIPGYADQSDAQSGGAGEWEQLSCTIVPTVAGWCRVRLRSRDTSGVGKCYFDDIAVA